MNHIDYKGFKIVRFASGNGSYTIYNTLGHVVATSFNTVELAQKYIDEVL